MIKGSSVYYYSKDGLGSVVNLTDSQGTITESYTYDEYGNVSAPSQVGNRYLYTGREYDPEINLYYYRARYYDPELGRFLQEDPIWDVNLYPYCANNPINWIDPYGLSSIPTGISIPGPSGEPVPITQDSDTGQGYIGFQDTYTDPFTRTAKDAANTASDMQEGYNAMEEKAVDAMFNNPATGMLDTYPPGQPKTGNPGIDNAITGFKLLKKLWNARKCQ